MFFKFTRILLVGASFAFLLSQLAQNWQQAKLGLTTINSWYLSLSFISIFPVFVLAATSWYLIVRQLGGKITLGESLPIWVQTNLARYIPGLVWQYLSRFYVSVKSGLSKPISLAALILEIILVVIAASIWSIMLFPWQKIGLDERLVWLLMPIALLPIFSRSIFNGVVGLIEKILKINITGEISWSVASSVKVLPLYLLNFLLNGLSLFFLIQAFGITSQISLWQVVGIFSLSWLIGYLTIFAPGGLGVTEVSQAYLLSYFIPFPAAVLISIVFRLVLIVAEIGTFMLVFVARNWKLF